MQFREDDNRVQLGVLLEGDDGVHTISFLANPSGPFKLEPVIESTDLSLTEDPSASELEHLANRIFENHTSPKNEFYAARGYVPPTFNYQITDALRKACQFVQVMGEVPVQYRSALEHKLTLAHKLYVARLEVARNLLAELGLEESKCTETKGNQVPTIRRILVYSERPTIRNGILYENKTIALYEGNRLLVFEKDLLVQIKDVYAAAKEKYNVPLPEVVLADKNNLRR